MSRLTYAFLLTINILIWPVATFAQIAITPTTTDGTVPGTAITYTITATGTAREIFAPGASDGNTWAWSNGFPEFVGTDAHTLTVDFSAPIPLNRIILGVNSISAGTFTLTLTGGAATTDFDLTDGLTAVGGTGDATYTSATGEFTVTGPDQSLMIGSTSSNTITQLTLSGDGGGDGYTLFFGVTDFPPPIPITPTTTDGTVPGTAITYTITATGTAREIFAPGASDNNTWSWSNGFPEFLGAPPTSATTLTVDFSAPVPLNRIVLGVNSISTSPFTLTLSGGTAATTDFDLSDGLTAVGGAGNATYTPATGEFTVTGPNESLMIGSTSSNTITQFTLSGDGGGDGYTLFFALTNNAPPSSDADVSITKVDDADPVTVGDTLTYTVTASNAGPATATNVVVTDTLPSGVTLVSTSGCVEDPAGVPTCTLGDIISGGSAMFTITVTADAAGTVTNTAAVTSDSPDPDTSNNSVSEDTTINPSAPTDADVSITKVDDADPVTVGDTLTYTVTASNAGPATATNVVVTDTLPSGVTLVSTSGCAEDPAGVPTCTLADITSGGSALFTVTVTADAAGTVTNTAAVTADPPDPDEGNNSVSEDTTINLSAPTDADLSITKVDGADPVTVGDTLTYTVTASNAGPATATNVVVTDTLPSGVTLVSTSGCAEDPSGVPTCTLGDLTSGGSAMFTVTVTADAAGTVTNTAAVTSDSPDPDTSNNSISEDTTVNAPPSVDADLSITSTSDIDPAIFGGNLNYTITVSNAGPATASNVVVTDTLPAGVTLVSTSGCAEDPTGIPTCTLGDIASGSSATFTITVTVGTLDSLTNTASVTSDSPDPDASNNSVSQVTVVAPLAIPTLQTWGLLILALMLGLIGLARKRA